MRRLGMVKLSDADKQLRYRFNIMDRLDRIESVLLSMEEMQWQLNKEVAGLRFRKPLEVEK